jgi:hypothetical protein
MGHLRLLSNWSFLINSDKFMKAPWWLLSAPTTNQPSSTVGESLVGVVWSRAVPDTLYAGDGRWTPRFEDISGGQGSASPAEQVAGVE